MRLGTGNMNDDRIRYITYRGQRILLVDYTDCTAAQFATICDLVPSYVTPEPEHTVLLLADFSNAQLDRDALEHVKLAAVFDRPHLKRSAWVITPSFPKAFYENVKAFSVRELRVFQTREQAMHYLVAEDEEGTQELAPPA
jgi:hypothetical protein